MPRAGIPNRTIGAVFVLLVAGGACASARPDEAAIDPAVRRAARYLAGATLDNGMFRYRVNLDPDVEVKRKYNVLRHAGAIYALCTYLRRHPDDDIRRATLRAAAWLRDEALAEVPGEEGLQAIWSRPEVNNASAPLQAKLGGAGLGLVALTGVEALEPGFTPLEDLQALGRFVLFMQEDDGRFVSKYIPSAGGRDDSWESRYYPGEAALGLVLLHRLDEDARWLRGAAKALGYLARRRAGAEEVPTDHWALLATATILPHLSGHDLGVTEAELRRHAIQVCVRILEGQVEDGGFVPDGRTTPTATRLEGLLAARSFLPEGHLLRARIDGAAARGVAFLRRAQIRTGPYAGGMPRAVRPLAGDGKKAADFDRRRTEVRIDYVQHAMCAWMHHRALRQA